jgi:hypothetical protein
MLPGNAYYDKQGKFLGYYEYKAWGTFFPLNNRIWKNVGEFFELLEKDFGIEYKSVREHFVWQKTQEKIRFISQSPRKNYFHPSREPPGK